MIPKTEEMLRQTMRAGLEAKAMPNFGPRVPRDLLEILNIVYDEARNRAAGQKVKAP